MFCVVIPCSGVFALMGVPLWLCPACTHALRKVHLIVVGRLAACVCLRLRWGFVAALCWGRPGVPQPPSVCQRVGPMHQAVPTAYA